MAIQIKNYKSRRKDSELVEEELSPVTQEIKVIEVAQPNQLDTKINFVPTYDENSSKVNSMEATQGKVSEIVSNIFSQAVVHTVKEDDEVKKKLLDTAKQVVADKTSTIADMAETESKEYHFKKNLDACTYFGYDERTTSKFHVKVMAAWAFILNTLYIFTIGIFVVSPIAFIAKKLKVVIKHTWLVILLSLLIYGLIVAIPIISSFISKWVRG